MHRSRTALTASLMCFAPMIQQLFHKQWVPLAKKADFASLSFNVRVFKG